MNSAFKSRATIMKIVSKPVHAESLQSCPTLCNPMDCSPPVRLLCPWDSPGKNTGVGGHSLLQGVFPSPGDLPNPGIEPGSPALQAHSLPSEPPGKHCI